MLLDEKGTLRAGADEAHVAPQDIVGLRQLIDSRPPQDPAYGRHAGIILRRQDRADVLFRIGDHRAELAEDEEPAVLAHPLLPVEDRTGEEILIRRAETIITGRDRIRIAREPVISRRRIRNSSTVRAGADMEAVASSLRCVTDLVPEGLGCGCNGVRRSGDKPA